MKNNFIDTLLDLPLIRHIAKASRLLYYMPYSVSKIKKQQVYTESKIIAHIKAIEKQQIVINTIKSIIDEIQHKQINIETCIDEIRQKQNTLAIQIIDEMQHKQINIDTCIDEIRQRQNTLAIQIEQIQANLSVIHMEQTSATASLYNLEEFARNKFFVDSKQIDKNYYSYLLSVRQLTSIYPIDDKLIKRIGSKHDGGYCVTLPPHSLRDNVEKIVYSFGISDNCDFEDDMVKEGYDVYMFDHTIPSPPVFQHLNKKSQYHYFKQGLSDTNDEETHVYRLDYLLQEHNNLHKKLSVLKIDIEGNEYTSLLALEDSTLKQFYCFVLELHNLTTTDRAQQEIILNLLNKINVVFSPIHIHWNNWSYISVCGDVILPNVLEVTYLNKDYLPDIYPNKHLPLPFDTPNNPNIPEHCSNYFLKNFVQSDNSKQDIN